MISITRPTAKGPSVNHVILHAIWTLSPFFVCNAQCKCMGGGGALHPPPPPLRTKLMEGSCKMYLVCDVHESV